MKEMRRRWSCEVKERWRVKKWQRVNFERQRDESLCGRASIFNRRVNDRRWESHLIFIWNTRPYLLPFYFGSHEIIYCTHRTDCTTLEAKSRANLKIHLSKVMIYSFSCRFVNFKLKWSGCCWFFLLSV